MPNRYDFNSIPLYSLGAGIVGDLKTITFGLGKRYLVVVDRHVTPELRGKIEEGFARPLAEPAYLGDNMLGRAFPLADDLGAVDLDESELSLEFVQIESRACTKENAKPVGEVIAKYRPDVVVAVGGGKCLDLVRAGLHFLGAYGRPKLVMVPTILTTNAAANGISIMYDENGQMCDFWNLGLPPECVVVDTELIAAAPARFLVAGIGDQISSSIEAIHTLEHMDLMDAVDPFAAAHHRAVLDVLEAHAAEAVASVERGEVTRSLEAVCHALTQYTGAELSFATSFLSHILDEALISIPAVARRMHGEIVAYGIFPEMAALDRPEEMDRWLDLYGTIGLPRTLAELGIPNAAYEDILAACRLASDKIMASRALVRWTPEQMAEAVMEADRLVRERLGE